MRKDRSPLRVAAAALLPVAALVIAFLVAGPAPFPHDSVAAQAPAAKVRSRATPPEHSEAAVRLNNLGIAEMEQFHFTQAASYFEKARAQEPRLTAASVNLAMAFFYDRKNEEAERILKDVLSREPNQRESRFILGLLYRSTGRNEEALSEIQAVLRIDPQDPAALYFAGALNSAQHNWDQAVGYLRTALVRDPINVSIYYALATALVQKGDTGEAEKVMGQFQELKSRGTGTSYGNQYLEQGRYAQAIQVSSSGQAFGSAAGRPRFVETGRAAGLGFVHAGPKDSALFDATGRPRPEAGAAFGSGIAFLDYDGDGWPDIYLANVSAPGALYRNNHDGTFKAMDAGISFKGKAMGVAAGDYDNDGFPDLFVAGLEGSALYHNDGKGTFSDKTSLLSPALSQSWAMTAAFVDVDHDGDLDLFVTCAARPGQASARNLLYRNNGDGTFTETAEKAGIAAAGFAASTVFMDYNASRDIDILQVDFPQWKLLSNKRDGTFSNATASAGLPPSAGSLGVASGDFDGDGRIDIAAMGRPGFVRILWNEPSGYKVQEVPLGSKSHLWNACALDYDNDGDLDLLLAGDELRLLENDGRKGFVDVTADVGLGGIDAGGTRGIAVADYDRDGDLDIAVSRAGRAPLLLRNDGGNRNHFFRLSLRGKADNHFGIGAKIEWAAGGLWQHREPDGDVGYLSQSSGDILLGLGRFASPDYVRVLWPTGVLQSEIPPKGSSALVVAELDRKGTSCPILYAWNGAAYEFVTDFLGGSATGYLEEPGQYGIPDTDEYVKIDGSRLRPRGDGLSLKMVNQLEEVMLFDAVRLLAVDHPARVEVFPNERLMAFPPFPEPRIYTAAAPRPVASATDGNGVSWQHALEAVDREYVRGFRLLPFKGYAEEHSLILDLGDLRGAARAVLLMDGWIDYANSSSNFSAAQAGLKQVPPYLQVWDAGRWRTVLSDMGFPAGLPKTMLVDLTGKVSAAAETRVRIVTNMRIYWDRIRIETAPQDEHLNVTTLQPREAHTAWVGYPKEWSPDGQAPFYYDYARRDATAPWKLHAGSYTTIGDVLRLLRSVDDRYVILPHGEEIAVEFPAGGLPGIPNGWVRDWLLYVDGFGKDMDLHSQYPDTVAPLPHHRDLPYGNPEALRIVNSSR